MRLGEKIRYRLRQRLYRPKMKKNRYSYNGDFFKGFEELDEYIGELFSNAPKKKCSTKECNSKYYKK